MSKENPVMVCTHCGASLRHTARVCIQCGNTLQAEMDAAHSSRSDSFSVDAPRLVSPPSSAPSTYEPPTVAIGEIAKESDRSCSRCGLEGVDGHGQICRRCGRLLVKIRGIEEAVVLYREAAEQGLPVAQYRIAKMYRDGIGVVQDDTQAIAWFRKSAEQGNRVSQEQLQKLHLTANTSGRRDARAQEPTPVTVKVVTTILVSVASIFAFIILVQVLQTNALTTEGSMEITTPEASSANEPVQETRDPANLVPTDGMMGIRAGQSSRRPIEAAQQAKQRAAEEEQRQIKGAQDAERASAEQAEERALVQAKAAGAELRTMYGIVECDTDRCRVGSSGAWFSKADGAGKRILVTCPNGAACSVDGWVLPNQKVAIVDKVVAL